MSSSPENTSASPRLRVNQSPAMALNESIIEDAALEWFGQQRRVAPSLTLTSPTGRE